MKIDIPQLTLQFPFSKIWDQKEADVEVEVVTHGSGITLNVIIDGSMAYEINLFGDDKLTVEVKEYMSKVLFKRYLKWDYEGNYDGE